MTAIPPELAWADPRYSRQTALRGRTWHRERLHLPRPDLDAWAAYATRVLQPPQPYIHVSADAQIPTEIPDDMWGVLTRDMAGSLFGAAYDRRQAVVSAPRFWYRREGGSDAAFIAGGAWLVEVTAAALTVPWVDAPEPLVADPDPEPPAPRFDPAELLRMLGDTP